MGIKSFNELSEIDLSQYISKKPVFKRQNGELRQVGELDYLNWADCLFCLHQNGAESVIYGNEKSALDHPVFLLNNALPYVRVYVEVDGERHELDYPVIDGSRDITMDKILQSDIQNATQRAFVKCVAVNWGLGLYLWQRAERNDAEENAKIDLVEVSSIPAIKERIQRKITSVMKRGMTEDEMLESMGLKKKIFDSIMDGYFRNISILESELDKLLS